MRRDKDGISGGCSKRQTFTKSRQEKSSVRTHSWGCCRLSSPLVCRLENTREPPPEHQPGTAPSFPSLLHHSWLNTVRVSTAHTSKKKKNIPLVCISKFLSCPDSPSCPAPARYRQMRMNGSLTGPQVPTLHAGADGQGSKRQGL